MYYLEVELVLFLLKMIETELDLILIFTEIATYFRIIFQGFILRRNLSKIITAARLMVAHAFDSKFSAAITKLAASLFGALSNMIERDQVLRFIALDFLVVNDKFDNHDHINRFLPSKADGFSVVGVIRDDLT